MLRRHFLGRSLVVVGTLLALPRALRAEARAAVPRAAQHPTPRAGITAAKMMTPEQVESHHNVADAFEGIRAIPQIADGIRCHCGCADIPGYYSLLTCYEGTGAMALTCPICAGEGRMTARLFKEGQTLDQIREALDARYG